MISQVASPSDFVYTPQPLSPTGKNHSRQYWANFNLDLGPVAITYIPAYRTWYGEHDGLLARRIQRPPDHYTPKDWFMTHELRVGNTDNDARFNWQTGLFYYDNTLSDVDNLFNLPAGPYAFQSDSHKSTTPRGAFAESVYAFVPDTRLTAGVRYDHTGILNTEDYTSFLGLTRSLTGNEGLRTFNNLTYKVRLEHDLTPQNLVYATIATGFYPATSP